MAWLEASATTPGLIAFAASGSCGHYGYSDCGHETYVNALYKRNLDELATLARALGKDGVGLREPLEAPSPRRSTASCGTRPPAPTGSASSCRTHTRRTPTRRRC